MFGTMTGLIQGLLSRDIEGSENTKRPDRASSDPEQRLADGIVTNNFRAGGIGIHGLPQGDVGMAMAAEAGEQQAGRADGKHVEVLYVLAIRPRALVFEVWVEELSATVRQLKGQRVVGSGDDPYSEE
jgi:hypothetical protein